VARRDYLATSPLAAAGGARLARGRVSCILTRIWELLMGRIRDLRIGTKLAVTSGLTFLLIGGIIFTQVSGNAGIREANETATRQHAISQAALSAKAALRGMQVGVAEIRLASGAPDLKAAEEYLDARLKSANNYCAEIPFRERI
jgi:hypothetical protein